ncbi:hypothetical protein G6W47_30545 [Streptomyces sp. CAI-21]|uniref:Rpn family recombination-promoting nuclease/putative transposase n=2 Tax=Streptomyces albidoflavus TaxID=1886 RepID=A0ABY3GTD0_9ACTN|nr:MULTISPECIES: hypothetical protein [Streptomyces]NUW11222.1 hypothetical protein [Streptomyces sp. CAI-21]NVI33612.1 hypothetical protein [Streptomyces sp. CAI-17]MBO1285155.1 hypothetical protein [Streptomyces sampsonii]MCX4442361.1 hypothetical protein [Streptomyces albidoflavus]MCX5459608.1 hypothetical protein [Streptomyces sp. FT1]
MVSSPHEAMHRVFQDHPGLFSRVGPALGVDFPAYTSFDVMPTDLTELQPVERRVDTLLRFDTERDGSFLLAVEAQGRKDPAKLASWAYYLGYLNSKHEVPPVLLVVCQDRATARWASQPIRIGPAAWTSFAVFPLVAGPHNLPVITDPAEAAEDLALAVLAAVTHAKEPDVGAILKALSAALRDVPEDVANPLAELTAQGLGKLPAADLWRNLMAVDLSFYKSPMVQEIREESRAEGEARALLRVLQSRGFRLSAELEQQVSGCRDTATLNRWLDRAVTAETLDEVFAQD